MKRMRIIMLAIGLAFFAQVARADWTRPKRLTFTPGTSYLPAIAVDSSGYLHVVWQDDPPGTWGEIYYRRSADGGTTWTKNKRLTWTSNPSRGSAIAVYSSGNLHVVWYDDTSGKEEIYYKNSPDGGASWTASQRLTWTSGTSYWPDIAVDSSGNLHVVWYDYTPGNWEIYYIKGK